MAAVTYKLDDIYNQYYDGFSQMSVSNCFPVRNTLKTNTQHTESGAWLVAHNAEQRRRFKAVLCSKPRTFEEIREQRKKSEVEGTALILPASNTVSSEDDDQKLLDGYFLLNHCHIRDPHQVCSINISDQGLFDCTEADFALFDSVAFINASENLLQLEPFSLFPELQELEISVNALRGIQISTEHFKNLQMLDISFNNLSKNDVLMIGALRNLKRLNITGNNLSSLSEEMSYPMASNDETSLVTTERFPQLEQLIADDNQLSDSSTFTALAGLRKLQYLSLTKNEIEGIPHLLIIEGQFVTQNPKRNRPKSGRKSKLSSRNSSSRESKVVQASARDEDVGDRNNSDLLESFQWQSLDVQLDKLDQSKIQPENEDIPTLPPPFSALTCINLSFNRISEEKSLLAVAAWPKLQDLIIHDNPLTLSNSGDPPVLKKLLQDRLGIHIQRLKPDPVKKPQMEGRKFRSQKIDAKIPAIPRCNVDELLLALEGPKHPALTSSRGHVLRPSSCGTNHPAPLPPIQRSNSLVASTMRETETSKSYRPDPVEAFEEGADNDEKDRRNGEKEGEEKWKQMNERSDTNPVFMTEMGDVDDDENAGEVDESKCQEYERTDTQAPENKPESKTDEKKMVVSDKYRGYELLLDIDPNIPEETLPRPSDINGNVKALRYMLNHPLIFRDNNVSLDKPQKPYQSLQKKTTFESKPVKTKSQKTEAVLENLKNRQTLIEAPLTDVISNKSYQKLFGDPKKLLDGVQNQYTSIKSSVSSGRRYSPSKDDRRIKPLFAVAKN